MERSSFKLGYVELILAQVCLAVTFVLSKELVPYFPITSLLFLKFLIGFISIGIYLYFCSSNIFQEIKSLDRRDLFILLLQAICSGFLFNILTLHGLQYTTATVAGIVNSTFPIFIVVFSILILKESVNRSKILAITLAVIGIGFLSFENSTASFETNFHELYGLSMLLLAMVPGSLFSILAKMMRIKIRPLTTTFFINFVNFLLFIPLVLNNNWLDVYNASFVSWFEIFVYCISNGVLFFYFWYKGLERTTANTAALFVGLMPVFTSMIAYLFLGEKLSWFDAFGMFSVILSIIIGICNSSNLLLPIQKRLFNLKE